MHARVRTLLDEGKLSHAARVLRAADAMCTPSTADDQALMAILLELGNDEDAALICARLEAIGQSSSAHETARAARAAIASRSVDARPPDPDRLFRAALVEKRSGHSAAAQRLFDRSLVELERAAALDTKGPVEAVRLDVPNGLDDEPRKLIRGDGKLNWVALRLDDSLETLDASTFQIRQRVSGDTEVIAISSDGGFLADERYLHGKDGAVVLELRDGHTLALIQKLASWTDGHSSKDAAFSPDGAVLTLRLEGELRGWDLRSGATMSAQAVQKLKASQPPNQNRLTIDNAVDWVRLGPHSSQVTFMSWEPNTGRWLTTSGDGSARIWDEHTGQSLSRIETMDGSAMAWSPDGSQVVGGCGVPPMPHNEEVHHDSGQHICIWNRAGDHKYALQDVDTRHFPTNPIVSLSFAPDGRTLAVVSEEGLKLWDIPNARLAKTLDVWVCGRDSYCSVPSQIEFDRDGTLWALRGGFLHWGADGSALPVPKLPEYPAPGDYWSNFSLPAFGDLVAVGGYDQSLIVNRGNSAAAKDAIEGTALFFDPAAATLFLDKRNRIDALDMATRKIRFSLPGSDSPNRSAFSEKNHEVLISYHRGEFRYSRHIPGGSMRLWSTASGRPLATIRAIDGTDDSYVMTEGPNARIEFFGDTGRARAFCRSGPLTLPFAACAERFEVTGLLEKQRSGDLTYLDP